MNVNPITLEVIRHALESVAEQMTASISHAGYSDIVKEGKDCSSALFDRQGRLMSEGANVPIHLNCLAPVLATVLADYFPPDSLEPGDLILTNDPYLGNGSQGPHHTNDVVSIQPVFWEDELFGFATIMVHHSDVGGMWSGNGAWNQEIWQEGLRLQPVKLYRAGQLDEQLLMLILNNSRRPYHMRGDLLAQVSACRRGVLAVGQLLEKYGSELLAACAEELMGYSERRTRAKLATIPDGRYEHEELVLEDGTAGGPYRLKVALTVQGSDLLVDYTGTDPQIKGPINAPWSATYSATLYTLRCLTGPTIPSNDGCRRPITILAPEGSLVNCRLPAACYQRMVVCHSLVDLIMGALAPAIPHWVMADSCGCIYNDGTGINLETHGRGGDVEHRQGWSDCCSHGGLGARPDKDGISAMACHVTNVANPPVEVTEIGAPVLILERALRPDSGGPGQYRGGLGQIYTWKSLAHDVRFNWTSQKTRIPPQGLFGGKPGQAGRWIVRPADKEEWVLQHAIGTAELAFGDSVVCLMAGGGGYGDPFLRDPEAVRRDVMDGLVSVQSARDDYGVVIMASEPYEIDVAATEILRGQDALGTKNEKCTGSHRRIGGCGKLGAGVAGPH
ncbi:MAG: hydantoinase B/oxoprolinase family protein [Ardenticatenaceae bacterium]|nr:hydantoinase B/oxoprolinase family protein [Ardenticatenaceae bacterium]